jgi:hypothetical protein
MPSPQRLTFSGRVAQQFLPKFMQRHKSGSAIQGHGFLDDLL